MTKSLHFTPPLAFAFTVALAACAGCTVTNTHPDAGGGGGDATGADANLPPGEGLRIEPANFVGTVVPGTPVLVDYHAILRDAAGTERDVTTEVTWTSTVATLGDFGGTSRFTSVTDRGGVTSIRATMATLVATTPLTLRFERDIVTSGTPPDAVSRFGGVADPSRAPSLVYPLDGTMIPPNLSQLEFHYETNGSTLFQLAIATGVVDLRIYFECPEPVAGGCIYTPDRETWGILSDAARGAGPITYRLRGVDAAGNLGETSERTIAFAEENITGGLYYWNAAAGSIMRFEFGVPGAREETFLDRARTGAGMCVGCHVLSRDGSRIGVGTDLPTTTFQVFDVASRMRVFSLGGGGGLGGFPSQPNFASFSPDTSEIVTSSIEGLRFLNGTTGAVVRERIGGGQASMPDWSPDGDHIVFCRHNAPSVLGLVDTPGITDGRIVRLDRAGSDWVLGPTLVSTMGQNNYHPTYSPDGEWVVFNRSPSNTNSMGSDADSGGMGGVRDAEIWVVSSSGMGVAVPLDNIHGLADSWPKFDPTEYRDHGHALFWLAWSSRREYGLRYAEDAQMQIWMAAFDPTRGASEPTVPPFRLPFQNIESGNHIAQWVTTVERQTCTTDVECGGEFCVDGRCYDQVPVF